MSVNSGVGDKPIYSFFLSVKTAEPIRHKNCATVLDTRKGLKPVKVLKFWTKKSRNFFLQKKICQILTHHEGTMLVGKKRKMKRGDANPHTSRLLARRSVQCGQILILPSFSPLSTFLFFLSFSASHSQVWPAHCPCPTLKLKILY